MNNLEKIILCQSRPKMIDLLLKVITISIQIIQST